MYAPFKTNSRGFTIVELLVVIVVIGILAAITIVAFNGISGKAQESAAKSGVTQANRNVMAFAVENADSFPATLGAAGVQDGNGTTYQYTVDNVSAARTYCVTATVGTKSFYQNNTTARVPTAGVCPGHSTGLPPVAPVWVERTTAGVRAWSAIASSADGVKLAAVAKPSQVMISTDSGATWTPRGANRYWSSIASSSDGTKIVASAPGGYISTSTDSGTTWVDRTASGIRDWWSVASSADGTKLVAVTLGPVEDGYDTPGSAYVSIDSGATWTLSLPASSLYLNTVSVSADGNVFAIGARNSSSVQVSTNGGSTWVTRSVGTNLTWTSIGLSSDGAKMIAAGMYGVTVRSSDTGVSWVAVPASTSSYVASSSNGSILVKGGRQSVTTPNLLALSRDSGATWTDLTDAGSRQWSRMAMSADGTKFAATVLNGYIYTATTP